MVILVCVDEFYLVVRRRGKRVGALRKSSVRIGDSAYLRRERRAVEYDARCAEVKMQTPIIKADALW